MRVSYDNRGGWIHTENGFRIQITDETLEQLIAARNEYLREQKHRGKR